MGGGARPCARAVGLVGKRRERCLYVRGELLKIFVSNVRHLKKDGSDGGSHMERKIEAKEERQQTTNLTAPLPALSPNTNDSGLLPHSLRTSFSNIFNNRFEAEICFLTSPCLGGISWSAARSGPSRPRRCSTGRRSRALRALAMAPL